MLYFLFFNLISLNYIASFFKKSNLFILPLIILTWILYFGNNNNPDYENYLIAYEFVQNGIDYDNAQFGFVLLMQLSDLLGFDYHGFLSIASAVSLILIYLTIKKYTKKASLVFVLYFIHPFFLDIVQVKHFIAMSIVVYSIHYVIDTENKIKFLALITIATSIHFAAFFFFPLIFLKKINYKPLLLIVGISIVFVFLLDKFDFLKFLISQVSHEKRIESYFENRSNFGFIVQFSIQIFMLLIVYYLRTYLISKNESVVFADLILKINIYLLILFPFYVINGTFERAFRMSLTWDYILFSLFFSQVKIQSRVASSFLALLFSTALFTLHVYLNYNETIFHSIFKNNFIMNNYIN